MNLENRLTEIRVLPRGHWTNEVFGVYRCTCGWKGKKRVKDVRRGFTRSCGCLRREVVGRKNLTHGHARGRTVTRTLSSFHAMWKRCTNPNDSHFKSYGGRGINVCRRWRKFENFLADMGERPAGKTLDRKDNDKNYTPANCRWATSKEQSRDRGKRLASARRRRT